MNLHLVDTSVWVDFFRANDTPSVRRLKLLLRSGAEVCLSPQILQEILQGACSEAQFDKFCRYFSSQRILMPKDGLQCAIAAARLYFDCRRRGITVRSANDCLIAQLALEYDAQLLHNDADFVHLAQVAPELQQDSG